MRPTARRLRRCLALLLVSALVGIVIAAAAACGGDSTQAMGPRLGLDADSFHLGDIGVSRTVQRSVEFRNEGDAPLTVSIVKVRPAPDAACGCGIEGSQVTPHELKPGETGELVFYLRAPEGMERMEDRMVVELASNDPTKPNLTFTLVFNMAP